jgi:hypothetical protein
VAVFYLPPAGFDGDFARSAKADDLRTNWDTFIGGSIADRDEGRLFYDAKQDPAAAIPADRVPIPWNGFPRSLSMFFNAGTSPAGAQEALRVAEILRPITAVIISTTQGDVTRFVSWRPGFETLRAVTPNGTLGDPVVPMHRQQDEYCEWHVDRDTAGIRRISFTAEGPEYWREMAEVDPDLVVKLYQELIHPSVVKTDLFWQHHVAARVRGTNTFRIAMRKDSYNPYNKWNTTHGAMHLTHPANTLGAEVNLAADATVVFPAVAPQPASTLARRLICCAEFGGVNRSSDPLIGAGVNAAARAGKMVTLANPVGLYIGTIDISALRGPQNQPVAQDGLKIVRASADGEMILRAEVVAPAGLTLDQCTLGGTKLSFGGQIAQKITMRLFGLVKTAAASGRSARTAACSAKCCAKSSAPNFRITVAPNQNCAGVPAGDFDIEAPFTETSPLPEAPAPALESVLAAVAGEAVEQTLDLAAELPPISRMRNPLKGL